MLHSLLTIHSIYITSFKKKQIIFLNQKPFKKALFKIFYEDKTWNEQKFITSLNFTKKYLNKILCLKSITAKQRPKKEDRGKTAAEFFPGCPVQFSKGKKNSGKERVLFVMERHAKDRVACLLLCDQWRTFQL